ncbi:hypothetical protein BW897_31090, partial [Bacillus cereus]
MINRKKLVSNRKQIKTSHFSLSYRDVSELLRERGVSVHPTTIMRWVHEYGHLIYQIWKRKNKKVYSSWK